MSVLPVCTAVGQNDPLRYITARGQNDHLQIAINIFS